MRKVFYIFIILYLYSQTASNILPSLDLKKELDLENNNMNKKEVYLKSENISVTKVPDYRTVTITNLEQAILCYELKDFEKDYNFFLEFICEERGATINTKFYYKFIDSCYKNEENYNTSAKIKELNKYNNKPNLDEKNKGFYYEYEFVVDETKHRGFAILITNFTGNKLEVTFTPFSMTTIFIIIGVIILVVIIITVIVVCCICKCVHKRKAKQMKSQLQSSFVEPNNYQTAPIVPEENTLK